MISLYNFNHRFKKDYYIQNASKYIYAIGGTLNIIINEEVKDALVRES